MASVRPSDDEPHASEPQEVHVSRTTARVPEDVGVGAFATGAIVLQGAHEFLLDFVQRLAPPPRIAARVVLPVSVVPALIQALRSNLALYEKRFGPIARPKPPTSRPESGPDAPREGEASPEAPRSAGDVATEFASSAPTIAAAGIPIEPGSPPTPPSIEDIYADLKFPDELQPGKYANGALVRHDRHTFGVDFVASVFPRSIVTSRVLLPAAAVPELLASLSRSFNQWRRQRERPPGEPPANA